jgi:hypothetical protein
MTAMVCRRGLILPQLSASRILGPVVAFWVRWRILVDESLATYALMSIILRIHLLALHRHGMALGISCTNNWSVLGRFLFPSKDDVGSWRFTLSIGLFNLAGAYLGYPLVVMAALFFESTNDFSSLCAFAQHFFFQSC